MLTLATSSTFSTGHIALTGAISGSIAAAIAALWLRGEHRIIDALAIGVVTAAAVFLLRKSANLPQLNNDGLSGFSANDWLAPTVTWVALGVYGAFRPSGDQRRYQQARGAATGVAFAINVLTI